MDDRVVYFPLKNARGAQIRCIFDKDSTVAKRIQPGPRVTVRGEIGRFSADWDETNIINCLVLPH